MKPKDDLDQILAIVITSFLVITFALAIAGMGVLLAMLISAAIIFLFFLLVLGISEQKRKKDLEKSQLENRFYEMCKEQGITYPISKEKNDLLKSIALKVGVSLSECEKIYNDRYKAIRDSKRLDDKLTAKEIEKKIGLLRGSKYIQGLSEKFYEDCRSYSSIMSKTESLLESKSRTQAKKQDWAIAGGLAQGLGGVGVGVATAIDVQRRNLLAEESARKTREDAFLAIQSMGHANWEVSKAADRVVEALHKMEKMLDSMPKGILEKNCFTVTSTAVRESGTLLAIIDSKKKEFDYAIVSDGIVAMLVKDGDDIIGEGYIVSPGFLDDFKQEETLAIIDTIGLKKIQKQEVLCFPLEGKMFEEGKRYTFEFNAIDVWEVNLNELKDQYRKVCETYKSYKNERDRAVRNSFVDAITT